MKDQGNFNVKNLDRMIGPSVAGFVVRLMEVAIKLALYMLAARLLGERESGFLFLAMTFGHLAATVCRLGIERALTRLVAAELSLGQGIAARRLLVTGCAATTAMGLLCGVAVHVLAPVAITVLHDPDAIASLRACAWTIPAMTLAFTLTFALVGLGRTVIAQLLQNLLWPLGLLAGLLGGLRTADSIVALAASLALTALLAAAVLGADRRRLGASETLPTTMMALPSLWRTARPLYVVELVQVSIASLPVMILGLFANSFFQCFLRQCRHLENSHFELFKICVEFTFHLFKTPGTIAEISHTWPAVVPDYKG